MTLPTDLKHYEAPRDSFQLIDDVIAFLSLVALALTLLAWWGVW